MIECYNCKQRGHYSNKCPKKRGEYKKSANIETIEEDDQEEVEANAADDELSEREDRLYAQPDGPDQESFDEQSNNEEDDSVSINDWGAESCAAQGVVQSKGEDEPDVIYHGEPRACHRASLVDWSVGNGYPDDETVPVEEFAEELGRRSEDEIWESLVV